MKEKTSHQVVRGAILLTLAGLFSKVLSATYRIPLQNLTGDLGFYIYQQVYPIIGTVMILSLYGFPMAVSKLTAERREAGRNLTFRHFYLPILLVMSVINGVLFFLIYVSAPSLAQFVGDEHLQYTYRLAAFLFLFIPLLALVRGSSQGKGEMHWTAYSQMMEQLVRVAIIIVTAYFVFVGRLPIYDVGKFGVLATMAGMSVATIFIAVFYFPKQKSKPTIYASIPWRTYFYTFLSLGLIASLNHMILILIQLVDVMTLVPHLVSYGWNPVEAMEQKGIFDRGQPLIQFGVVFGSSFALALIPTVVKKSAWSDEGQVKSVREAILFSFYIATGATIGLIMLLRETNILLFTNDDGTRTIQVLILAMILTSVTITVVAILQTIGYIRQTAIWIIMTFFVKWGLNSWFVPHFGIMGSAIATVVSLGFLTIAVTILLYKKLPNLQLFHFVKWKGFTIASSMMIVYLSIIKYIGGFLPIFSRVGLLVYVCLLVASGALVYLASLIRYDVLTENQYRVLPFSRLFLSMEKVVRKKEK